MRLRHCIRAVLALAVAAAWVVVPAAATAHSGVSVGDFHLIVGWGSEPALAGQPNTIDVLVTDHDEKPVNDLAADALSVVVSTAGQDSQPLALASAFDLEEGLGTAGQYAVDLMPTVPGEYTFHITGSIHDQPVDVSITSGDETFSSVETSSDIEFPVKVPTLADVATRLDRIDGRIDDLGSGGPAMQAANDARAAAQDASDAANRALLIGSVIGGTGLVVAIGALWFALRAGRRGAGTA